MMQAERQWWAGARSNGGGGGGHPALQPGHLQPGLLAPGAGKRLTQSALPAGEPHGSSLPVQASRHR